MARTATDTPETFIAPTAVPEAGTVVRGYVYSKQFMEGTVVGPGTEADTVVVDVSYGARETMGRRTLPLGWVMVLRTPSARIATAAAALAGTGLDVVITDHNARSTTGPILSVDEDGVWVGTGQGSSSAFRLADVVCIIVAA